jgi:hypothetical protein
MAGLSVESRVAVLAMFTSVSGPSPWECVLANRAAVVADRENQEPSEQEKPPDEQNTGRFVPE